MTATAAPAPKTTGFLTETHPHLAAYWHPELNGPVTPDDVKHYSRESFWWNCPNGHGPHKASVYNRTHTQGCRRCRGVREGRSLAALHQDIAAEWHPELNGNFTPDNTAASSSDRRWFICPQGHEPYQAKVNHRTYNGSGCPDCGRNRTTASNRIPAPGSCLADKYPELARFWDAERNSPLTLSEVAGSSNSKAWWSCAQCSGSFERVINSVTAGGKPPRCAPCSRAEGWDKRTKPAPGRSIAELFPGLALDWDDGLNGDATPADFAPASKRSAHWKCRACGTETYQAIASRLRKKKDQPEIPETAVFVKGRCTRCGHHPSQAQ